MDDVAGEIEPKASWRPVRTDVELKCWRCGRWFRARKFRGYWYLRCTSSTWCIGLNECAAPEELCYTGLGRATYRRVSFITWKLDWLVAWIERRVYALRVWRQECEVARRLRRWLDAPVEPQEEIADDGDDTDIEEG